MFLSLSVSRFGFNLVCDAVIDGARRAPSSTVEGGEGAAGNGGACVQGEGVFSRAMQLCSRIPPPHLSSVGFCRNAVQRSPCFLEHAHGSARFGFQFCCADRCGWWRSCSIDRQKTWFDNELSDPGAATYQIHVSDIGDVLTDLLDKTQTEPDDTRRAKMNLNSDEFIAA